MRIHLVRHDNAPPDRPVPTHDITTADVPDMTDDSWVTASVEAAWYWLRHTGSSYVTAVGPDDQPIVTVGLFYHDG